MSNPFYEDESNIADQCIWKDSNGKSQCSIAKVTAINSSPVSVNIQPLVNYFDQTAGWTTYPILQNIPVIQFQTAAYSIVTPLNVGDTGLVLWFDREAYTTLLAGAVTPTTPDSGNMSDINACVFLPILPSFTLASSLKSIGLDFISSRISLLTQLQNLCTQLTNLTTALAALTVTGVTTGSGISGVPVNAVVITNIGVQITAIQTNLVTFIGAQG